MLDNNINIKTHNPVDNNNASKPTHKPVQVAPLDVADPARVTRTPKQDFGSQSGQNQLNYNPDSVFEKFIKSLGNSPVLSEGAKKLLLNKQFINSNIKSDSVLKSLFETFLKSIEMDETEILNFLKFQHGSYTKFQGDFFNSLRSLLKSNPDNNDFKIVLRNFLKSYDCFVSVDETNKSINAALKNIERNLPDMLKSSFSELTDKLLNNYSSNGTDINLNLLKNEILPFVGRYISKMNDFGPVRDYVSVLIHNMVRLENASRDNFSENLDNLFEFVRYNFSLDEEDMQKLKMSLIDTYETASSKKNDSVDSFLKLIDSGIKESKNLVNKGTMEDMAESLLFSQDVHIPLTHMFLPLNFNNMFMFSEIWIGKEFEISEKDKKSKQTYVQTYKVFITFDIQNVGYFETTLVLKESRLSLDIYVPNCLTGSIETIKNDLNNILSKDNLSVSSLNVNESIRKRRFNEVFSNLSERKSGVDVTI
ncbi:hypothetical protein [Sedimentibacter saalensis]|jgi:hypothetical protein|uniref:hypothetical protein n=1 Tax=Sedimentibacter saalensis TaxID=130788 RepID=UPI0028A1461B|nr:hypothetical protein [Sedimentibacter saalensis]MEA5095161.1 hypothetical protein [Sedimentibacter saalensis]